MRRAVVVTFLGVVACGNKGEQPLAGNPPAPTPAPAPVEPAPADAAPAEPAPAAQTILNGRDPTDGVVMRGADGTCYVNVLPAIPAGQPTPSFRVPDHKAVDCPAHMTDPSWDVCAGGVARTAAEGADCVCIVVGNPPPPPRPIACPKGGS